VYAYQPAAIVSLELLLPPELPPEVGCVQDATSRILARQKRENIPFANFDLTIILPPEKSFNFFTIQKKIFRQSFYCIVFVVYFPDAPRRLLEAHYPPDFDGAGFTVVIADHTNRMNFDVLIILFL